MYNLKLIIFDFDGVIVESVDVKTNAFRELFKVFPEKLPSIIRYHLENGGISRFDKFRHIYKDILQAELSDEKFNELCSSFSRLVFEQVIKAPAVNGVMDFLGSAYAKYPLYVISATPNNEIKEIVKRRSLSKYFMEIYGAPKTKVEAIREILTSRQADPNEAVFIGDSRNDYAAARETGVRFIARSVDPKAEWLKDIGIGSIIADFSEIGIVLRV